MTCQSRELSHCKTEASILRLFVIEGVLETMLCTKPKIMATVLITVGLLGAGWFTLRTLAADRKAMKATAIALGGPAPVDGPKEERKTRPEVEKLQGTWNIISLEVQGVKMAESAFKGSKIVVKGNTFTTISMGATYKGTFRVDETGTPKTLDMIFTEGPEKGNTSLAIYEVDDETWKICLTIGGKERPKEFVTKAGSGHALETLKREADNNSQDALRKEVARLEGEWSMVSGEIGGQPLPEGLVKSGKRVAKGNETTVTIGGQIFLKAIFTIDASKSPKTIDYKMTDGPSKGKTQYGIYECDGDTVRFCFSAPGKDRPTQFTTKPGDQRTLGVWKRTTR